MASAQAGNVTMDDTVPDTLPDIRLSSLKLTDFRNYKRADIALDGRHVVLTGPNGAGKTNLMEAVSLLTPGRGLRRATLSDMARGSASDGFSVFAHLTSDGEDFAIGTGTSGQADDALPVSTRRVRINGTQAKTSDELMDLCRVAWLTPAMDGLFTGSAGDRRRFLDRMVLAIDPTHGRRALNYEKAMRQRNRLLDQPPGDQTDRWLDAAEAQLASLGTAILASRQELVSLMTALVELQSARDISKSPFPTALLTLTGELETEIASGMPAGDIETQWLRSMAENRFRDRAAGRTLIGPHRADLSVHNQDKDISAALCSTGEQKALLIGLILAHAALTRQISGMPPILLLDEIAAHLDPDRRAALFDRIDMLGGQAFMTGTDRSLFDALGERAQYVDVRDGELNG